MNVVPLTNEEQIRTDCQFKVIIKYTDFTAAALSQTINAIALPTGTLFSKVLTQIVTGFNPAGTCVISIGGSVVGAAIVRATNDVKVALCNIASSSAEFNAAQSLTFTCTSGSGNLSTMTAGEAHFYIQVVTLPLYNV